MNRIIGVFVTLLLAGCATGNVVKVTDSKIEGPRVIALQAPSAPWVIEVQNKLKQKDSKYYVQVHGLVLLNKYQIQEPSYLTKQKPVIFW
jgi:hypothetical protein